MNKHFTVSTVTAALLALTSGCYYTQIATPAATPEMQEWERVILESYPGYTPPKATNKNYRGEADKRVSTAPRSVAPAPMDANAVPAETTEVNELPAEPEPQELPAESDDNTPAMTEVKAEAAPAEAPAPAPAPAEEVKAEAAPAEAPAPAPAPAEEVKAEAAEVKAAEAPAPAPAPTDETKAETAEVKTEAAPAAAITPPDPTNSTVYEVKYGDTLGSIAHKTYGSARYSNVIFKANSDILKNPDTLRPGMKLIIPKL